MLATTNEQRPIKNVDGVIYAFYSNLPKHKALIFDQINGQRNTRSSIT